MSNWDELRKLDRKGPFEMGLSDVYPFVRANSEAGVAVGYSVLKQGSMTLEAAHPEIFVVVEGAIEIRSADKLVNVAKDQAIWFPAGSSHEITIREGAEVFYVIVEG